LVVAIPFGVASAIAYGASTAVQHSAAHTGTGEADPRGLLRLLRDPRWLLSIGGDTVGFALQVVALSTGPVVLIQPLLVLTLPVSLAVGSLLDGTRPRPGDYVACLGILGGLAIFFAALGSPGTGRVPSQRAMVLTVVIALVAGGALCASVWRRSTALRAGVYGGVAGAWFGTCGVLVNASTTEFQDHGIRGLLTHASGLVPLVGLTVIGGLGITLTQISFQVGALAASFPANKSADPVAAVILGAVLLHEHVQVGWPRVIVYLASLVVIVIGAVRLAASSSDSADRLSRAQ
jgi:hypothetical protein